jgi:hypothetical protein
MNPSRLLVPVLLGAAALTLTGCLSAAERKLDGIQFKARTGSDATGDLEWIADPPVRWSMTTMNNEYTAVIIPPCTALNAPVSVTSDTITVDTDQVIISAKHCEGPEASRDAWVESFIEKPIDYTWDGETLDMSNGHDSLTFTRIAD